MEVKGIGLSCPKCGFEGASSVEITPEHCASCRAEIERKKAQEIREGLEKLLTKTYIKDTDVAIGVFTNILEWQAFWKEEYGL